MLIFFKRFLLIIDLVYHKMVTSNLVVDLYRKSHFKIGKFFVESQSFVNSDSVAVGEVLDYKRTFKIIFAIFQVRNHL